MGTERETDGEMDRRASNVTRARCPNMQLSLRISDEGSLLVNTHPFLMLHTLKMIGFHNNFRSFGKGMYYEIFSSNNGALHNIFSHQTSTSGNGTYPHIHTVAIWRLCCKGFWQLFYDFLLLQALVQFHHSGLRY